MPLSTRNFQFLALHTIYGMYKLPLCGKSMNTAVLGKNSNSFPMRY